MYTTSDMKDWLQAESSAQVRKWASALEKRGVKIERIGDSRIFTDDVFIYLSNMKRVNEKHPNLHLDQVSYLAINNLDEIPEFIPEILPQEEPHNYANMEYVKKMEKQLLDHISKLKNSIVEVEEVVFTNEKETDKRLSKAKKKHKKLEDYVNERDNLLMRNIREMQELKKSRRLSLKERITGISKPIILP